MNKIKLTVLLLITALPVSLATLSFKSAIENGDVSATSNKGNLILPPADITALAMHHADGQPVFLNFEEEIASLGDEEYEIRPWLLLYVTGSECDAKCQERIHYMQQLHIALGKNIQRVRRYYLHASDEPIGPENAQIFESQFPSMGIAYSEREVLELNMASAGVELSLASQSYIVLVDPVGNVMMYYTDEQTAEDIMADLETLLKYSSLG
ncbi:MAG: hypothetical protein Q8L60_09665 [Gammaproteobacteria bacterium]|nr:hypothetical protein [Gammaproteobacteria bacterium]MDP2139699.1 hypothetical protein [Gammaproteobacteria bacterium]MDP2348903.1 hypothetical protein [Gammaproteobacteria bacterium]